MLTAEPTSTCHSGPARSEVAGSPCSATDRLLDGRNARCNVCCFRLVMRHCRGRDWMSDDSSSGILFLASPPCLTPLLGYQNPFAGRCLRLELIGQEPLTYNHIGQKTINPAACGADYFKSVRRSMGSFAPDFFQHVLSGTSSNYQK
jgi:hypothetical protein